MLEEYIVMFPEYTTLHMFMKYKYKSFLSKFLNPSYKIVKSYFSCLLVCTVISIYLNIHRYCFYSAANYLELRYTVSKQVAQTEV